MRIAAILAETAHRPWALPPSPWAVAMRWTDLLFAHWPVPVKDVAGTLPEALEVDTYDGVAWLGIVPFRMEEVRLRGAPVLPGNHHFLEMNVRTYVREPISGHAGVYFFSLDTNNPLAAVAARAWYHLPYFWARMQIDAHGRTIFYSSRRLFSGTRAALRLEYCGAGHERALPPAERGTLEYFLTERYALFTHFGARLIRADIQHRKWILEPGEAVFSDLSIAAAQGIALPGTSPLLHLAEVQDIVAWPPRTIPG